MAKVLKDEYLIKLDSVVIYVEVTKFKAWYNTKMKNKEGLRTSTHNICIVMALFQWFEVKFTPKVFLNIIISYLAIAMNFEVIQ